MTPIRGAGAVIAAAGVLMPSAPAQALEDDRFELYVEQAFAYDDNIFRIAPEQDPATVLGAPSRGDSIRRTTLGFKLDVPVNRQRLAAELSFDWQRHDRFDVLDLDGHHGQLAWHWQAGERLQGRLGYAETLALASLANVQSGVQSSTPNFLETGHWLFDATLRVTPRWQVQGEVQRQRHTNSADEFRPSDATIDGVRLAPVYESPAGNRYGIGFQRLEGRLPNPQLVAGVPVDNDFRHDAVEAFVEWLTGGRSRLTVRAGRVRREYQEVPQRDFEGSTYRVAFDWMPADKLQLGIASAKEVSADEQVNVGFTLVEGPTLAATWKPRDKLEIVLQLRQADRTYLGDAAIAVGAVPARSERFESASVAISYRPAPALTLALNARRERRDSTVVNGDFDAEVIGVSIRFTF